jgi:hypothetical protein
LGRGTRSVRSTSEVPAKTLEQYLTERVFTEANVESATRDSITFLLKGDDVCPYKLADGSTSLLPADGATLDQGCVDDVNKLELRANASEPSAEGLDLTLMLGPDKAAPFTLELRLSSVAVVVSLDGVKSVLVFAKTLDSTTPVPRTLTGVVALKITFNRVVDGNVDVTFSSAVRQAVNVEVEDGHTPSHGTIAIATAAKDPLASLQVNGIDKAVTASLDLGATTVSFPYEMQNGEYRPETIALAGLSYAFSVQDGQAGTFTISNIRLGDTETKVTLGDAKGFSANLDPRHFAATFAADPANSTRTIFTVDPQFGLTIFVDNTPYGDSTDPADRNMTYSWSLSAATGKPQLEPYEYDDTSGTYPERKTAMKVVNGTLSLTDGTLTVTVPQGKCLLEATVTSPTSHVQKFTSGACP